MKRNGMASVLVCLVACLSLARAAGAQGAPSELQQRVAAAKQAAAANQQALRTYGWTQEMQVSLKGEVKSTTVNACQYGPDGKVQKAPIVAPPPQEEKRGLRGRVVEKKTGEMTDEMKSAAALVEGYVPPSPDLIQAAVAANNVSLSPAGPGAVAIAFKNYQKPGDLMTLTFDTQVKALRQVSVNSYLDDPSKPVTLQVTMQTLPDGTNYAGTEVLSLPASQLSIQIQNSNYRKVGY
jgi:hypothetical protein